MTEPDVTWVISTSIFANPVSRGRVTSQLIHTWLTHSWAFGHAFLTPTILTLVALYKNLGWYEIESWKWIVKYLSVTFQPKLSVAGKSISTISSCFVFPLRGTKLWTYWWYRDKFIPYVKKKRFPVLIYTIWNKRKNGHNFRRIMWNSVCNRKTGM